MRYDEARRADLGTLERPRTWAPASRRASTGSTLIPEWTDGPGGGPKSLEEIRDLETRLAIVEWDRNSMMVNRKAGDHLIFLGTTDEYPGDGEDHVHDYPMDEFDDVPVTCQTWMLSGGITDGLRRRGRTESSDERTWVRCGQDGSA